MISRTARASTANSSAERRFMSDECTTLATLRWTKTSPGSRPATTFAGTRLSEHPIQRNSGCCRVARRAKYPGSAARRSADHAALRMKRSFSMGGVHQSVQPAAVQHPQTEGLAIRFDEAEAGDRQHDRGLEDQAATRMPREGGERRRAGMRKCAVGGRGLPQEVQDLRQQGADLGALAIELGEDPVDLVLR